jgi:hypothetical protein
MHKCIITTNIMTTRCFMTRLHISPRRIRPRFKLARCKRQLDFARVPRQLCFPSTPGITDDLLSILSKILSCLSHRQTTHDVTDFRHGIDREIEKLSNQLLICRHKSLIKILGTQFCEKDIISNIFHLTCNMITSLFT